MTSERGGAAHFDCPHHPQLLKGQFTGPAIGLAVLPKNAGQLES
jgi:hypothetical protein